MLIKRYREAFNNDFRTYQLMPLSFFSVEYTTYTNKYTRTYSTRTKRVAYADTVGF